MSKSCIVPENGCGVLPGIDGGEARDSGGFDLRTRTRHLERKVKELKANTHLPADLVGLVAEVARRQLAVESVARYRTPDPATLARPEAHVQGAPLHPREDFRPDVDQAAALLRDILDLACRVDGPLGEAAQAFRAEHLPGFRMDHAALAHGLDNQDWFREWSARTPGAPRLVAFLVQSALAPALAAEARSLLNRISPEAWPHGHCPVCGSLPFISSLRGKAGERWAVCSHCATDYRVPRLGCLYCGETAPARLAFYDIPGEPGYRIDTCDACGLYVKTADFRTLDKISVPALDDLESLAWDMVAVRHKYQRPILSGWGF